MTVDKAGMTEECIGMFGALHSLTIMLIEDGTLNRERYIERMLALLAAMPERQRSSFYGRYLQMAVEMFEATQFPEAP